MVKRWSSWPRSGRPFRNNMFAQQMSSRPISKLLLLLLFGSFVVCFIFLSHDLYDLSPFICFYFYTSFSCCVSPFICFYLYMSGCLYLSLSLSVCLCVCLSLSLSVCLFVSLSLSLSLSLSQ